jgi:hypothetical protein
MNADGRIFLTLRTCMLTASERIWCDATVVCFAIRRTSSVAAQISHWHIISIIDSGSGGKFAFAELLSAPSLRFRSIPTLKTTPGLSQVLL